MRISTIALSTAAAGAVLVLAAGPATAGEITGNGQPTQGPNHARSICVFSGLNDSPNDPFPEGGRTQNFGQLVRQGVITPNAGFTPGDACNPNAEPPPPPG
jgi:hypothetical protein